MQIQSIRPYSIYCNNSDLSARTKHTFMMNRNLDEFSAVNANPIWRYAQNIFKRSLAASARRIFPIEPTLREITNEVRINSSPKESTYAWDIRNRNSKKYVLYLHGASQNITNIQPLYESIIQNTNYSILALEYRGFGKNNPKEVNSNTFLEDTTAAVRYLKEERGIKSEDIFVVGHSMGAFPACQLASKQNDFGRLILVAPLGSVIDSPLDVNLWFAKRMPSYVKFLFKNFKFLRKPLERFFRIENHLKKTQIPVDIIHSTNDRLIKYTSSEQIASVCPNLHKLIFLQQGGHKMEKTKINAITELLGS